MHEIKLNITDAIVIFINLPSLFQFLLSLLFNV